ncbi:MAG TPA: TMEM165/GDT1 family protein [Acidimicrobiales bacterium]|nr:TMEM165/GDT1 family protein [Acidimicrobiales bacterium]
MGTFLGIAAAMFLLELPDKTMIATIVMAARTRPLPVAIGASVGFVVQMAIAVAAGGLVTLLPDRVREIVVTVLFLGGALYLLISKEERAEAAGEAEAARERRDGVLREAATAFGVIFLAEFGDLTQIQALTFTAHTHAPLEVFLASSIALVAVAFLGAYGGRALERRVPLVWIRRLGGVVFLGFGVYSLVQVVR